MDNQVTNSPAQTQPQLAIDVLAVAKAQKALLILVLINLLGIFFLRHWLASLIMSIAAIYYTYQLLTALHGSYKIIWIIGMLIPLLNIILLLVLNDKATKAIRAKGFKVSLMGANIAEMEDQIRNHVSQS